MRALLISPEFPLSFWSFQKSSQLRGNKTVNPPLGLITVAALLPPEWELRLVDLNVGSLTEEDWQWADLILISAMYIQKDGLLALVREAKLRGKTVVAGGPYPTSLPEAVLEFGCDLVVRGEGENTMPLLLEALRHGKTGIIESNEKPELSTSPIPRFDLLQLSDYSAFTIQTSRGCPFDCEFCDVVNLFGRKPRYKSPQQVIAELETLYRLGARGSVFVCDDNFIGSKKHAQALLQELTPWLRSRGEPFKFVTQASVNLGQDLEMIDLMTAANFDKVFVGIESPDENVLQISHKYHNIKNPLVESLQNIQQNGLAVIGSFIIGLDGEKKGAGKRICAFLEQTAIPVAMLGILQAAPHTRLWHRLEGEGRLRQDMGDDLGTFSAMNFEPDRPEADVMQEYVDAWNYLYEPSRYLARAYRCYLAMRPAPRAQAAAAGGHPPQKGVLDRGMGWRRIVTELKAFLQIIRWQGVRTPYRRQFWTQMIGMWRQNPTRFVEYISTCAVGEDLFDMRRVVGEKATAIIEERQIGVPTARALPGAALGCEYGEAQQEPSSSRAVQD
ncbi:MAG: B12-binding domain-containing radical SAM protein [Desulfobaccales bacterium]